VRGQPNTWELSLQAHYANFGLFVTVYALFKATVNIVDHAKKSAIARELLLKLAPEKAKSRTLMRGALVDLLDEFENDCESIHSLRKVYDS